ncbi:MAG: alpha-L-rhamnosidase C-terminal domain-containing protein [Tepidisphaeraceae bacterium]
MGFSAVSVRPQLGPLRWAKGAMIHPRGRIEVDVRQTDDGRTEGRVVLPAGVTGTLHVNGTAVPLVPGERLF